MLRVGLIGDPVAHSRSPDMHNAAFAAAGIDARYALWPTPAADLAARIASLRESDVLGANVTIPHKLAVIDLLDALDDSARRVGAVNTIVNQDGALAGANTDAPGLAAALTEVGRGHVTRGIVLGAGGAARAAIVALADCAARAITVAARRLDHAEALVDEMQPRLPRVALDAGPLVTGGRLVSSLANADVVINATPIGMAHAPGSPLDAAQLAALPPHALVADLLTTPTALVTHARARGLAAMDGLPMLARQGALAWELWTGQPAPLDAMRHALGLS